MKRNKQSTKAMRNSRTSSLDEGSSRYALKVRSKKQMYGPGCCGNQLSPFYKH